MNEAECFIREIMDDRKVFANGCQSIDGDQIPLDMAWGFYHRGTEVTFKEKPPMPCTFDGIRYRAKK